MFRGIVIWTAFCLGLFVMWQLAAVAAERDRQYQEHYAIQGQAILDEPADGLSEPVVDVPRWHRCAPWSAECESHRSELQTGIVSRLQ